MKREDINELLEWGKEHIIWAGSDKTNKSSRQRYLPQIIVNHMSQGTAQSCIDWFNDEDNQDSSAHFLVSKTGHIYQFLSIEDNAWGCGITVEQMKDARAEIVKANEPANPNWYSVNIEHEGVYEQSRGKITPAQLEASIMLHRYVTAYVEDKFFVTIKADNKHILGHSDINPKGKPFCPGEQFPLKEIIASLNDEPKSAPFPDTSGHWAEVNIQRAKDLGLVVGFEDGTFKPDELMTRAQAVTLMLKLYDLIK